MKLDRDYYKEKILSLNSILEVYHNLFIEEYNRYRWKISNKSYSKYKSYEVRVKDFYDIDYNGKIWLWVEIISKKDPEKIIWNNKSDSRRAYSLNELEIIND